MAETYLGEIKMFGGNFAPRGFALCNGQLIAIQQNTALFSLVGTFYGGNGTTTFGLPDLRGRFPMHQGTGAGLTPRVIGESGGTPSVTLLSNQMPAHVHAPQARASATTHIPTANLPGTPDQARIYGAAGSPVAMDPNTVAVAGGSQAHENRQPYLGVTFIIAVQGIYPARN